MSQGRVVTYVAHCIPICWLKNQKKCQNMVVLMSFGVLFSAKSWLLTMPKPSQSKKRDWKHLKSTFFGPLWSFGAILGPISPGAKFTLGVTISQYRMRVGQNGPGAFSTLFDPLYPTKVSLGPNTQPFWRYWIPIFIRCTNTYASQKYKYFWVTL
jgi:hypothetical protein